jgi:hypothetical protein
MLVVPSPSMVLGQAEVSLGCYFSIKENKMRSRAQANGSLTTISSAYRISLAESIDFIEYYRCNVQMVDDYSRRSEAQVRHQLWGRRAPVKQTLGSQITRELK